MAEKDGPSTEKENVILGPEGGFWIGSYCLLAMYDILNFSYMELK
jgi:hypothetical protein